MNEEEHQSLTWLLSEAVKQLNWISKQIIDQNRTQKEILAKVVDLDYQIKNDLILKNDIGDRIATFSEEINEVIKK